MTKTYPGDLNPQAWLRRELRVNHAGEYGAVRIYKGQLQALRGHEVAPEIQEMLDQEEVHLQTFEQMLNDRRIRPTALSPLWHMAGYALGYVTGKMGPQAAMACTVAVEEVIDEHYGAQEARLAHMPEEQPLHDTIKQFRAEECAHRDHGLAYGAPSMKGYVPLKALVKTASRLAIFLSKKI